MNQYSIPICCCGTFIHRKKKSNRRKSSHFRRYTFLLLPHKLSDVETRWLDSKHEWFNCGLMLSSAKIVNLFLFWQAQYECSSSSVHNVYSSWNNVSFSIRKEWQWSQMWRASASLYPVFFLASLSLCGYCTRSFPFQHCSKKPVVHSKRSISSTCNLKM